jgi:hypothetical protein
VAEDFLTNIKRVVADPAAAPTLNDLLNVEAARLVDALAGDEFDPRVPASDEGVMARLDRYATLAADLARAVALGARWSGDLVRPMWHAVIERVVAANARTTGQTIWIDLSLYPGVLLVYAGGVAALAGSRYDNLRGLLLEPRIRYHNERRSAVENLNPFRVMNPAQAGRVVGLPSTFAPLSDRLARDVRPLVSDIVADDAAFDQLFDRFEYLLGLIHVDATGTAWGPAGRFAADQYGTGIDRVIDEEITEAGASWAPLAAGLFGGSRERRDKSLEQWRKHIEEARREARFSHLR